MSVFWDPGSIDASRPWSLGLIALRVVLALFFLWLASRSLTQEPQTLADFARWGYSPRFLFCIGLAQAVGAVALLFPATCLGGASILAVVLIGALYTHLRHDPVVSLVFPLAVLVALGLSVMPYRNQLAS